MFYSFGQDLKYFDRLCILTILIWKNFEGALFCPTPNRNDRPMFSLESRIVQLIVWHAPLLFCKIIIILYAANVVVVVPGCFPWTPYWWKEAERLIAAQVAWGTRTDKSETRSK